MSAAFLSALENLTSFNKVLRDKPEEQPMPKPVNPKDVKITTRRNRSGDYVVLAVTKGRRRIKRLETHRDQKEAHAAARRIGKQVKAGKYIIEW